MTYVPPASNWDDKFHKLRITCARKGVRIQAKNGYYAWREPVGARTQQAIESVVATTFDAAEIGLRATISKPDKSGVVRLNVNVDARDLAFIPDGDAYKPELRYAIIGYATGRPPRSGPLETLEPRLDNAAREKVLKDGISITQNVTIDPQVDKIRLAIFDRASNAIGSISLPVAR